MAPDRSPTDFCRWPGGWTLTGKGPSYLLFKSPEMEVTHLANGLHRNLRKALKGYEVINAKGELVPLVEQLLLASADTVYDADSRPNARDRKWAAFVVVREIEKLIHLFPDRATFEAQLSRLGTSLRAAGEIAKYHSPPGVPESEGPPGSFFAIDVYGQRLLIMKLPPFVLRCESESLFAECAQELWRQEQESWSGQLTSLYRIPSRRDLREHLNVVEARITQLARAEGLGWLPTAAQAVRAGYQEPRSLRRGFR